METAMGKVYNVGEEKPKQVIKAEIYKSVLPGSFFIGITQFPYGSEIAYIHYTKIEMNKDGENVRLYWENEYVGSVPILWLTAN